MQTMIKQIREHLNISQTELAKQLNVTFATVNRWENGRADSRNESGCCHRGFKGASSTEKRITKAGSRMAVR